MLPFSVASNSVFILSVYFPVCVLQKSVTSSRLQNVSQPKIEMQLLLTAM